MIVLVIGGGGERDYRLGWEGFETYTFTESMLSVINILKYTTEKNKIATMSALES